MSNWIRCSERMPLDLCRVLFAGSLVKDDVFIGFKDGEYIIGDGRMTDVKHVKLWMPIPEPPKEGE